MPAITVTAEADGAMTVLLTGSTGSLGSYLLDSLVRQQHVRKIYCLNRAEDGLARQKMASDDRRLDTTAWGEERVEFLHVDLSLPIFGLSRKKYDQHTTQTTSGQLTSTGTSPRSSLPYAASGICWTSASTRHSASSSIVASSKRMGLLPSSLGSLDVVNWVPVDLLSDIILELARVVVHPDRPSGQSGSAEVAIYHAVNPHGVRWATLAPTVADIIGIEPDNIVSWSQWVDALRLSGQEKARPETNPGLKLLDFFESLGGAGRQGEKQNGSGAPAMMPLLATEISAARSKTLASLKAVGTEWMALWVRQMGV